MTLFYHLIWFFILVNTTVWSQSIDSNASKSGERDDSTDAQLSHEQKSYSSHSQQHSSPVLNTNGYNNQNINTFPISRETSSSQMYGSGHQNDNHFDRKERKTLILAIPVKLSLPNGDQSDSYDSSQVAESSNSQTQSLLFANNPYHSPYSQLNSLPMSESLNSEESEESIEKRPLLPPLSQKIYSTLETQSKGSSYSSANNSPQKGALNEQQLGLGYNSDNKHKTSDEYRDQRENPNQYTRNVHNYRSNAPKGVNNRGVDSDYVNDKYKSNKSSQLYDDSYETRIRQKERSKILYEQLPENKPEYDYDSTSDGEEDDTRAEDIYNDSKDNVNKNIAFVVNHRKNQYKGRSLGSKPEIISPYFAGNKNNKESAHQLPLFSSPDGQSFDGWSHYYRQMNSWPQLQASVDANLLNLMNSFSDKNKESVRNGVYGQAFDVFADSQFKAASNPIPYKTLRNSKIYAAASNYQPISLFTGYGRDYGLVDLNGDLYPTQMLAQTPPGKEHKPLKQYNGFGDQGSRDSIKTPPRNPLLLRPSFMSGLRSVASKPLANYSPFASASSVHPFLSTLQTLPNSFHINKSIPRQIFPLFYG